MSDAYLRAMKDGVRLSIYPDDTDSNPREWDNLGTMVCFHKRYTLGDKHDYDHTNYDDWQEMEKEIIREEDVAVILPLYLYDHSGITMSIGKFSCPWDSGQVGFIYVTKEKLREKYDKKRVSQKLKDRAEEILESEVETYDQYLTGDVFGFSVEKKDEDGDWEDIDSCWGFYGSNVKENGMTDYIPQEYHYLIDALA